MPAKTGTRPETLNIQVTMPKEMAEVVRANAISQGMYLTSYVRHLIAKGLASD
jgi:hypothetical protein